MSDCFRLLARHVLAQLGVALRRLCWIGTPRNSSPSSASRMLLLVPFTVMRPRHPALALYLYSTLYSSRPLTYSVCMLTRLAIDHPSTSPPMPTLIDPSRPYLTLTTLRSRRT